LAEAARAAGFVFSDLEMRIDAKFPRRSFTKSGYVMVAKKEGIKKSQVIKQVADKLWQRKKQKGASSKK
jgi:signal recognition particle subunit SRP19